MKRIGLVLVALMVSMSFYGQAWDTSKPDKRFTFGIRAGVNFSNVNFKYWGESEKTKSLLGFHSGAIVDYNIVKSFAIESGLFYTRKGWDHDSDYYFDKNNLGYLELPLLALYRLHLSDNAHLQIKGGGYIGYLVSATHDSYLKDFDTGLEVGVGVSFKKIYLGLKYELGLLNIYSKDNHAGKIKNRNLMVSVGYDF